MPRKKKEIRPEVEAAPAADQPAATESVETPAEVQSPAVEPEIPAAEETKPAKKAAPVEKSAEDTLMEKIKTGAITAARDNKGNLHILDAPDSPANREKVQKLVAAAKSGYTIVAFPRDEADN